jgi:selenide, water dikinase
VKLAPGELAQVLRSITPAVHPDLLVGTETADDAAVWRISEDRALVVTADFITPIVDDARTWGRIAATNSVSDVYAMGGRPLLALNLVGWNTSDLPTEQLIEVLAGATDVATGSGFVIVGGHSVDDPEPKFGLAVVGEVHPDRVLTNKGLRDGDVLILTKPLGTGIIATAIKHGAAPASAVEAAVASMLLSNAEAAAAALEAGATGATDVSGFGLLGHLGQMAVASGVDVAVDSAAVPLLPDVRGLAEAGMVPGGTQRNLAWVSERVEKARVDAVTITVLADAQTSGGLVFGAEPMEAAAAVQRLRRTGHECAVIGWAQHGEGRLLLS